MRGALRFAACVVLAAAAGWAVHGLYLIYVCNIEAKKAERQVIDLIDLSNQVGARIGARDILEQSERCIPRVPWDVDQYMIRAAALRMLGRPAEAAMDYRRALRFDRRAELYLNLGQAEAEAGRPELAEDAWITAVYLVYSYVDSLPEPMQRHVRAAVTPNYVMIQQGRAPAALLEELRQRVTRDPR